MKSFKTSPEQQPVNDYDQRRQLGMNAAQKLLMAVEKLAWVEEYQRRIETVASKRRSGASPSAREARLDYHTLLLEMDTLEDKLAWRQREANDVVDAHPTLRLLRLEDQSIVKEGVLQSLDLSAATISIGEDDLDTVQFAASQPVPEGLHQQYFGHVLLVNFEVLAITPECTWALR